MNCWVAARVRGMARGLLALAVLVLPAACGSGSGSSDWDSRGPYTMTFSLDESFQEPHGDQPISIALVRSIDGVIVEEGSGTVSSTENPSFTFSTGAVMRRFGSYKVHYWIDSNIGGGSPGVCDAKEIDHQWSTEFPLVRNDIDFTVPYKPALVEDVCGTFN